MSLKYSTTTADYLRWDEMSKSGQKIKQDGDYKNVLADCDRLFLGIAYL